MRAAYGHKSLSVASERPMQHVRGRTCANANFAGGCILPNQVGLAGAKEICGTRNELAHVIAIHEVNVAVLPGADCQMSYLAAPVYHVREHDSSTGTKIAVVLSVGSLIERCKVITDCQGPWVDNFKKVSPLSPLLGNPLSSVVSNGLFALSA
jgi:hypothetical protein